MGRANRKGAEGGALRERDPAELREGILRAALADGPIDFPPVENPELRRFLDRLNSDPRLSKDTLLETGMTEYELGHFVRSWFEALRAEPGDIIVLEPTDRSQAQFVRMARLVGLASGVRIETWWPDEEDPAEWSARADFAKEYADHIIFSQIAQSGSGLHRPGHIWEAIRQGRVEDYKKHEIRWNLSYLPSLAWARRLHADPPSGFVGDEGEVFRQLARDLHLYMRSGERGGMERHLEELQRREDRLNEIHRRGAEAGNPGTIHISDPPGTDLQMTLTDATQWVSGRSGIIFGGREALANTITEEVWATPRAASLRGHFRSSAPLSLDDGLNTRIESLEGRFDDEGNLVELRAMRMDEEGEWEEDRMATLKLAAYFGNSPDGPWPACGEIGLVDSSGPIAQSGRKYLAIGLDENGALHIAIGDSYRDNGGGKENGAEEHRRHLDVPIGTAQTDVFIQSEGGRTQLIERGRFVL